MNGFPIHRSELRKHPALVTAALPQSLVAVNKSACLFSLVLSQISEDPSLEKSHYPL